jgi:Xaa-Pro aminopeptidase
MNQAGETLRQDHPGNCGIYREQFGVRAEDTVWVSDQGPVSLTHHPKLVSTIGG